MTLCPSGVGYGKAKHLENADNVFSKLNESFTIVRLIFVSVQMVKQQRLCILKFK